MFALSNSCTGYVLEWCPYLGKNRNPNEEMSVDDDIFFYFYFNLYIYPPDSQESDGGAIHRVGNYPDLLPEMPRYCCPLVI